MDKRIDLSGDTIRSIKRAAEDALTKVLLRLGDKAEGRKGGYLRIFQVGTPTMADLAQLHQLYETKVGEFPEDKADKYKNLSYEKALRLEASGHTSIHSSWPSRNTEYQWYGGTVRVGIFYPSEHGAVDAQFIFSFSGLPELGDEALCIQTILNMPWDWNAGDIGAILKASNNPYIK